MPEAPADLFQRAFRAAMPHLTLRDERSGDAGQRLVLAQACSHLAGLLPEPVIAQQACLMLDGYRREFPQAMHKVVMVDGHLVGAIIVDWSGTGLAHGIDLQVDPARQRQGIGRALLTAWLAAADATARRCTLHVRPDNPAANLYRKLGFVRVGGQPADEPIVAMERP